MNGWMDELLVKWIDGWMNVECIDTGFLYDLSVFCYDLVIFCYDHFELVNFFFDLVIET